MMNLRIATLGAMLFTVPTIGFTGLPSAALDQEKYLTVADVELFDVTDGHETLVENHSFAPSDAPSGDEKPDPKAKGGAGDIISIGMKIWEIIEANRPVVNQNYAAISAVPAGVRSWDELDGWSEPTIRIFKLVYKNVYRMKVTEFEYRVAYTANGTYQGRGQYLSRVEIEPKLLNVAWGYRFNASGAILNVTNAGTKEAPLAAMQLSLNWSVETVLKHTEQSVRYYIRGDGLFKNLSDGNLQSDLK